MDGSNAANITMKMRTLDLTERDPARTRSDTEMEHIADTDTGIPHPLQNCAMKLTDYTGGPRRRRHSKWFEAVCLIWGLNLLGSSTAFSATFDWSAGLNRIYVEDGGPATLSDLKAALPGAPLDLVDPINKVWLLRADLFVRDGSKLVLRGTAAGGDVNELRLLSLNSGATNSVISMTADYGTLELSATKITSWDTAIAGPDTNHLAFGRAFVRVRSSLSTNGITALESRMDITNSEICYLGSDASEAYGLVWKVAGTHPNPANSIFDLVNVHGNVVNSHLHDNYIGAYTYGAFGMQWLTNEIDHNLQYGLDLQQDSDNLTIQGNQLHHNGNHGMLASDRCNQLSVGGNLFWANTKHGMLLEKSSDDSVVEANQCIENAESGIAVVASGQNSFRDNLLWRNGRAGLRLSLGSADNRIENNHSASNLLYGFHCELGSGTPLAGDDGRPKRNVFAGNLVHDNGVDPVRVTDSDDNRFATNSFTDLSGKLRFQRGLRNWLDGNSLPETLIVRTEGDTNGLASTYVRHQTYLKVELGTNGSTVLQDAGGRMHQPDESTILTEVSTNGTTLPLTTGNIGSSSTIIARNFWVASTPGIAYISHLVWTNGTIEQWWAHAGMPGQTLQFTFRDLMPTTAYLVRKSGVAHTNVQSDASGLVQFSDTASVTDAVVYSLRVAGTNNTPPSLPVQSDRTIGELATLTVANTATDAETPGILLVYALLSAPSNALIAANGTITWTPTEAQGPSTNTFSTVVTDNGSPAMNTVNTFSVVVTEVNRSPVLPAQTDLTVAALTQVVATNSASDPDVPANSLVYALQSAPANAAISSAGVITWTPPDGQGPSTNRFIVVVTDNGVPPLSATNSFSVFVNASIPDLDPNLAPGGNFDLTHWMLALPDANVTHIPSAQLEAGFTDPDYFFTDTDGAMTFWCPVTGGTTGGSEFPRSELREMIDPNDSGVNWTGYGSHRLNALCRVTQIPSSQRVIIGQIHSYTVGTFPLMALQFDDGKLTAKVKDSPNSTNETRYALGNIGLNGFISYELALVDGLLSMTVNGSNHTANIFQSDPAWTNQTFYFKAGSYCQDNDGPATEGAEVAFYQLSVEHLQQTPIDPIPLRIRATPATGLAVAWTASSPVWLLQRTDDLDAPNWSDVNKAEITLVGAEYQMVITNLTQSAFFRLKRIQP